MNREKIVTSPAFIKLFEKWRARRKPERKLCSKGLHRICPANAHVGDLRCTQRHYSCYPCWRAVNRAWATSEAGRAYCLNWKRSAKGRATYRAYFRRWAKSPGAQANQRAHNANCRARQLGVAGCITGAQFLALCNRFNNRCLCCGKWKPLCPDHVTPFSLGGVNVIRNIQPLCAYCNLSKHAGATDYRKNPHKNCLDKSKWRAPRLVRRALPNWLTRPVAQPAPAQSIEAELGIA